MFYKGRKSNEKMCGFEGVCYIGEVDVSKEWTISSQQLDNCYSKRKIILAGNY